MRNRVEDVMIAALKESGVDFVVNLFEDPTSNLAHKISKDSNFTFVPVCNEGDGISATAGAALAGRKCVFLTGVAGLMVGTYSLGIMNMLYRLPFVVLIAYRGDIGDKSAAYLGNGETLDVFGRVIEPLLDSIRIPYKVLSKVSDIRQSVKDAVASSNLYKCPIALLLTGDVLW